MESEADEVPDGPGIFLDVTAGESLVGGVEVGEQVVLQHDLSNSLPVFLGGVNTCGVVGSGVEEDNGSWLGILQRGDHPVDISRDGFGVVVGVLNKLEPCLGQDILMVQPGWVGNVDSSGVVLSQELEPNPQRPSP